MALAYATGNGYYLKMVHHIIQRVPRLLLAAMACSILLVAPALADVVTSVRTEYYQVDGTNPRTIYDNLKNHSPLNTGTETYQAHTQTQLRFKYKIRQTGSQCQIEDVVIYLDLIYLYPRLTHSVDWETRKWWKKFYGQLEEHELIHGEISTRAVHKLDDVLKNLGPGPCSGYKEIVQQRINTITTRMKQDQVEYDKLVEHGLKQERNMGRYP